MKLLSILCTALFALAACGGGSSSSSNQNPGGSPGGTPDAGTPIPAPTIGSFSASPDSLAYGGGTVTLSWSVTGATSVSIDDGVGDVTAKSSVSVDVSQSETFTLTATNSTGSVTATATVAVDQSQTVSGTVIDLTGQVVPGASVVIGSNPAAVSDASGHFSIDGVVPPFDVAVVGPDQQNVVVYEGLTASQLTLTLTGSGKLVSSAGVYGTVSGGNTPYDQTNVPIAAFASPEVAGVFTAVASDGYFGFQVGWQKAGSTTGSLFAFQPALDSKGNLTGYTGFGRSDAITLNPGSDASSLSVTINPVASAPLGGQISAPAGYAMGEQAVLLQFQPYGAFRLFTNTSGSASFGFNVPMIPQGTYAVVAAATPPNQVNAAASYGILTGLTPGGSSASLTLPAVPSLGTPVDQANAVDSSTSFSWSSPGSGAVFQLAAMRNDGNANLEIDVITSAATARLPDLSALGLALPSGVPFVWQVVAVAPFSGINEAATTTELGQLLSFRRDGSLAQSDVRSFTTR